MAKYKVIRNDIFPNEININTPFGPVRGFVGVAYTNNEKAANYLANNGIYVDGRPQFEVEEVGV